MRPRSRLQDEITHKRNPVAPGGVSQGTFFPTEEALMSLSRRALFGGFGATVPEPSAALITSRGREAMVDEFGPLAAEHSIIQPPQDGEVRISSNENPYGPTGAALEALQEAFYVAGRYPTNSETDGDGIMDGLDREPLVGSNLCFGLGDNVTFEFQTIATEATCAANVSIAVDSTVVVDSTGDLELIAPLVSFKPGFGVAGQLSVKAVSPLPPP